MSYSSERLDRIEALVESNARALQANQEANQQQFQEMRQQFQETRQQFQETRQQIEETRRLCDSNARAIQANQEQFQETRRLCDSNARAIQANAEREISAREELRQTIQSNQDLIARVNQTNESLARILVSLDEDRPTIFRKLNSIETKIDRMIENQEES